MSNATLEKEIWVETGSSHGIAGKLNSFISQQGANIIATWGSDWNGKGQFHFITDQNSKVLQSLKSSSDFASAKEEEVVVVRAPNNKAVCAEYTEKLGQAGININWFFTTVYNNDTAIVFSTSDNQKAYSLFK